MTDLPVIKTLKNGFRVVYVPFPGTDSITFRLLGRAGCLWENPKELGIAHYVEHLVFDGTKKYPNPDSLRRLIVDVGGSINGSTGFYKVNYKVKLLKEDMERGFDFLSQLVMDPLIKKTDVEKQRTVISQEYKTSLDDPVTNFYLNSQKYIYPKKHRLSDPIIGINDTINSINQEQLKTFHKNNYTANNFVLSVCAGNSQDMVFKLAEKYFRPMNKGKKNDNFSFRKNNKLVVYTEKNEKVQQSSLSLVFPAPKSYEKTSYQTRYLEVIFGKSFMSRLFREIRQKRGLAYYVRNNYSDRVSYGTYSINAQVSPKNVEKTISLIKKEINKILEKGITKQEFKRAKKLISSGFVFRNENAANRAFSNGGYVLDDKENENNSTQLEKYNFVTFDEVNRVTQQIFSKNPKILVLSNKITDEQVLNAWHK